MQGYMTLAIFQSCGTHSFLIAWENLQRLGKDFSTGIGSLYKVLFSSVHISGCFLLFVLSTWKLKLKLGR